jgi:hypothetical protein
LLRGHFPPTDAGDVPTMSLDGNVTRQFTAEQVLLRPHHSKTGQYDYWVQAVDSERCLSSGRDTSTVSAVLTALAARDELVGLRSAGSDLHAAEDDSAVRRAAGPATRLAAEHVDDNAESHQSGTRRLSSESNVLP